MSLTNVPSAEEAMGWNPQSLANYMRRVSRVLLLLFSNRQHVKKIQVVWKHSLRAYKYDDLPVISSSTAYNLVY